MGRSGQSWQGRVSDLLGEQEVEVAEMELRSSPGLDLDFISEVYVSGPVGSCREVNDFRALEATVPDDEGKTLES